jgi:hypothetical protein
VLVLQQKRRGGATTKIKAKTKDERKRVKVNTQYNLSRQMLAPKAQLI